MKKILKIKSRIRLIVMCIKAILTSKNYLILTFHETDNYKGFIDIYTTNYVDGLTTEIVFKVCKSDMVKKLSEKREAERKMNTVLNHAKQILKIQ